MGDTGVSRKHWRYRGMLFMGDTGGYCSWEIQRDTVHGRYRGIQFMGVTGGIQFMGDTGVSRKHGRYGGIQFMGDSGIQFMGDTWGYSSWEIQGYPGNMGDSGYPENRRRYRRNQKTWEIQVYLGNRRRHISSWKS